MEEWMTQRRGHYQTVLTAEQKTQVKPEMKMSRYQQYAIYLVVMAAALGGLLFGYDTAVISGALLLLHKSFMLTPTLEGLTVSAVLIGATIGAILGGGISNAIGRRKVLIIAAVIFMCGDLLAALSTHLMLFIACRILTGFAIGITACVVPVYISEMAPARLRGTLVTFYQLAITIGIAASYWVDLMFINAHMNWRPMFAITVFPALCLLGGMLLTQETPRWLATKGKWEKARQILERMLGEQTQQELDDIRASLMSQQKGSVRELLKPGLRMALLVGVGLAIFQQLVGINAVIYYAPTIFGYAGFATASSAILATSVVGVVNVLATVVASVLIDKVGRRPLLLCGAVGMTVTLIALGAVFALGPTQAGYLTLAALLIYVVSFALSMGPVVWLMNAEIFPTRLRATGSSVATFANWSANLLVSMTFLSLIHLIGIPGTFWLFALLGSAAFVFCWLLVPETRKKSLEQIERYWLNGRKWSKQDDLSTTSIVPEPIPLKRAQ